jgi:ABC-type antimicrobial peptide transport system permease subunit
MREAFREVDPEIALNRARPLEAIVADSTAAARFMTGLLSAFAAAAGALAVIGIYGVMAYAVRQRRAEIAIRMAVGADAARVVRLFVRQGAAVLGCGLLIGVGAALAAGGLLESQLVNVSPRDPAALGAAVLLFGAAGLLAVWLPSRAAARTDPAIVLRTD